MKLHIGCGNNYFNGWINIDMESDTADLKHDVRQNLPYEDSSIEYIYSEHFVEHLSAEEGLHFFRESLRVLKKGGIIRIATPDLDYLINRYIFNWRKQEWIDKYGYSHIKTKAEMMNYMFHCWGHKYLYNLEELDRRLEEAGFNSIKKARLGESAITELCHLETRKDSKLIVEAEK